MPTNRFYVVEREDKWVFENEDRCSPLYDDRDQALSAAKRAAQLKHRPGDLSEILVCGVYGRFYAEWSCGLDADNENTSDPAYGLS